jgi:hypothetical protein
MARIELKLSVRCLRKIATSSEDIRPFAGEAAAGNPATNTGGGHQFLRLAEVAQ